MPAIRPLLRRPRSRWWDIPVTLGKQGVMSTTWVFPYLTTRAMGMPIFPVHHQCQNLGAEGSGPIIATMPASDAGMIQRGNQQ